MFVIATLVATAGHARTDPDRGGADPPGAGAARDDALATYRAEVERGTAAFRDERFTNARLAFERAHAINADPVLMFNIASCWRRAGKPAQAVSAYRRFLATAPVTDPRRTLAERTIAMLTPDQTAVARAEAPPTVATAPVLAVAPSVASHPLDASASAVASSTGDQPRRRSRLAPVGLVVTAVGAVGLVSGAVEAIRARSFESDIESLPQGHRWGVGDAERYERGESAARRALILGLSGALVTTAGVTLYYLGRRADRRMELSGSIDRDGGGLVVRGPF